MKRLFAAGLASLLLCTVHARAASITSAGSITDLTQPRFSSGSDLADLDANGVGTDGFVLFNSLPEGSNQSNAPWDNNIVDSKPAYITALDGSTANSSGGWANYDDVRVGGNTYNTGGIVKSPGNGNETNSFNFTIGANPPGTIRVGIIIDNSDSSSWDATNVRLAGPGAITADQDTPNNGGTDVVQFDITAPVQGEVYTVLGTSPASGMLIGGITFDPGFDINDPTDSDGDGMGDNWETFYFGGLGRDGSGDFDSDGLDDLDEWGEGTAPDEGDSDGDGLNDGQEVSVYSTDPLDSDSDGDGFDDGEEVSAGTDPNSDSSFPTVTVGRPLSNSANTTRDSVVVFNEIHYHPEGDDVALEYVELYNQMAVNVDLSNWRIGGIGYDFPEGTVINARSYLVVAKVPANYPGALGPFAGTLSNSGERLRLYNNNRSFRTTAGAGSTGEVLDSLDRRRIMDEIDFGDTYPWPAGADGSGATLAKIDPATGSAHPQNWAHSSGAGGTPGAANVFSPVPAIAFNEIAGSEDATFAVELVNHGGVPVALGGSVIVSSNPLHSEYTLPAGTLVPGAFLTIDGAALGFVPDDNNRLFLFTPGKSALVDAVRADNRLRARSPEGSGRWLVPDGATFGAANSFSIDDSVVISEIFYHAYPQRASSGTPPTFTNQQVMDWDHTWRYNLDAGSAGLPAGWEDSAHVVDDISWAEGPGLLGRETSTLGEPIRTEVTLSSKVTYYFETEFTYSDTATVDQLFIEHYIDDGAVIYLNGEEVGRVNLPGGVIVPGTTASPVVSNATLRTLTVQNPTILQGSNRLSVEVHQATTGSSDLVLGMRASLRKIDSPGTPGTPYSERDEEWVELYNRGASLIDLGGWSLGGGIDFDFPAGTTIAAGDYLVVAKEPAELAAKFPGVTIIGDYSERLGNGGDTIVLEDANGNPADEVTYFDRGKWHAEADGGGSSLELVDPDSDNSVAGAWAASDESARSTWNTYTYEGVAQSDGIGNNAYHEFLIALLDAGEFLLDDVSVVENGSIEMIQNGDFEGDAIGATASRWRAIGTHGSHGRTVVVADPDSPGNRCLHVVATGPTEDKHNKLETTFANGEQVTAGATYRISFRAKFLSGSNQVNTRLYFNYLQRTTDIATPEVWGTPGSANSRAVANAGPTLSALAHAPVVPDVNQSVNVAIDASDPDGISSMTVFYSINGGAFQSSPMAVGQDGVRYVGAIPGQSAGRIVRFYVRAVDVAGATAFFPAAGADGGAFYKVQDGLADSSGLRHNFRIIMADDDRQFLFRNTNRMSNDRFPVTVIEDETTAYYDVGVRLKASGFGRFNSGHYGFNVRFEPDQLFRGVHPSISVERSPDLKEILAKHLMNRAGGTYQSFYDDAAYLVPPNTGDRGRCLLSMARQTNNFWDGIFPDADEPGTLFNHELLYNPNNTDGGPEGLKIGNPYNHTNGRYDLVDRGDDKEPYRWGFQIRSARGRDDYSQIVAVNQAMGNLSGSALRDALDPIIDADQWMRTFAMMSLNGTDDIYSRIWEHNFRYYVRPGDGRVIVLQWDLDRSFQLGTTSSITPSRNTVTKLFSIPQYRRLFDGHLDDLVKTTFNSSYVSSWASHFNSLTGSSNQTNYINSRANFALGTLPANVPFSITTNGGNDFSEADSAVDLEGDAWVDVFTIEVNGIALPVEWTDANSWRVTVPIGTGANPLTFTAINNHGVEVGSDSITVTNTSPVDLADASNTIISELHYHPEDPSQAEIDAGFADADQFEFIELTNVGTADVDFTSVAFTDGVDFVFPAGVVVSPGGRIVLVSDQAAFLQRYGAGAATIVGVYSGNLRNSGERVRLEAADDSVIADFSYGDDSPWPTSADGDGYSLVFNGSDPGSPQDWRPSTARGGNPGGSDRVPFTGGDLLVYSLASDPSIEIIGDSFELTFRQNLAADDAEVVVEFSDDLASWAEGGTFVSSENQGDGTTLMTYSAPLPPGNSPRQFGRVLVRLR